MKTNQNNTITCFKRWTRTPYAVFNSLGRVIKIGVLSTTCVLTAAGAKSALGQTITDTIPDKKVEVLEEIVIETDRLSPFQPLVQITAVIQRSDIERAAVGTLQDLLQYIQGIDLRARGSNGVQADISLKGGTFDQTAILLNGINISDPQTGHHSLNIPINIRAIDRIEVSEGPGSWASGNIAFSGSINIITINSGHDLFEMQVEGGFPGIFRAGAIARYKYRNFRFSVHGEHSESKGYVKNTDFNINNLFFQLNYDHSRAGHIEFQAGYQNKAFGANSFYSVAYPEQFEQTQTFLTSLRYRKQWFNSLKIEGNLYYRRHQDRFELFRTTAPSWYTGHNYHVTDVIGSSVQAFYQKKWSITLAGADYRFEHIFSNTLGNTMEKPKKVPFEKEAWFLKEKSRQHLSFYVQQMVTFNRFKAAAGAMGSGNNDYGLRFYLGGNISYSFRNNIVLSAWVHHTYRLPTFTDLYYTGPSQTGNPNLKPEEAVTASISASRDTKRWSIYASFFYKYGYRIIDWTRTHASTEWFCENLTNVQSSGFNIGSSYRFTGKFLQKIAIDYAFLYVVKNSKEYLSLYATDYLRNQIKINFQHRIWSKLIASWQGNFNDRAGTWFDTIQNEEIRYKPYFLCNLKVSWMSNRYEIYIEATNLFNTKYLDIGNLPQPGIWVKMGGILRLF